MSSKTELLANLADNEAAFYKKAGLGLAKAHMSPARGTLGRKARWAALRARAIRETGTALARGLTIPDNWGQNVAAGLYWAMPGIHRGIEHGDSAEFDVMAGNVARAIGWIRAVAQGQYKPLEQLLRDTLTRDRGAGSPYQRLDLIKLMEEAPSPGALARRIRMIRWAADRLLAPVGIRAAKDAVNAAALWGHGKPGKAAYQAVALTLGEGGDKFRQPPAFRAARAVLADRESWTSPIGRKARALLDLRAWARLPKLTLAVAGDADTAPLVAQPLALANRFRKDWFGLQRSGIQETEKAHAFAALVALYGALGAKAHPLVAEALRAGDPGQRVHDLGQNLVGVSLTQEQIEWLLRRKTRWDEACRAVKAWDTLLTMGWQPQGRGALDQAQALLATLRYEGATVPHLAEMAARLGYAPNLYREVEERWLREQVAEETIPAPGGAAGITLEGLRLVRLEKDDPATLFAGDLTGCCQHPGGVGASCAWHAAKDPNGAIWAVYKGSTMLAQAWVWRTGDTLVLDNIEAMGHHSWEAEIRSLFEMGCQEVVERQRLGVREVWVGSGMCDIPMSDWGLKYLPVRPPVGVYSDASQGWKVAG